MIDIFSKYATVIPLKERKAPDIMRAIFKGFRGIGKQPDVLFTDEEGALMQKDVEPEFEKMGVQRVITVGSAHFVERFNRTLLMISKRIEEMKKKKRILSKSTPIDTSKIQWSDLTPSVLAVYDNKNIHRITGLTPVEAKKTN